VPRSDRRCVDLEVAAAVIDPRRHPPAPRRLTRIDFVNGRPDAIDVLLRARRLAPP
jgi:hypothetical protein